MTDRSMIVDELTQADFFQLCDLISTAPELFQPDVTEAVISRLRSHVRHVIRPGLDAQLVEEFEVVGSDTPYWVGPRHPGVEVIEVAGTLQAVSPVHRSNHPDHCPTCDRRICDDDIEDGYEAKDGQRWCLRHYRAALADRVTAERMKAPTLRAHLYCSNCSAEIPVGHGSMDAGGRFFCDEHTVIF